MRTTVSGDWIWALTTTSPNRSAHANYRVGFAPCCGAFEPTKQGAEEPLVIDEDLAIDFPHRAVIVRGETIKLRPTEYRLLLHLVENAGWIVPQETLLSKVWGPEYRDDNQLLRLYITYLRKKIEPDPAHPKYILTERGVGYQFMDYKRKQ